MKATPRLPRSAPHRQKASKTSKQQRLALRSRRSKSLSQSPRRSFSTLPKPSQSDSVSSPTTSPLPKPLTEHVFFRVDVNSYLFYNHIVVSFPDHTPSYIIQESQHALGEAFKDRPDCQDYQQRRLNTPIFQQFGSNWNRYEWAIRQKEIDGALDPLLIQTVLLDHFTNNCGANFVSSSSSTWFHRDSVTHILQFPIEQLNYKGSYLDCQYDADGAAV